MIRIARKELLLLVVEPSGRRIKLMWIILWDRGLTTLCRRKGKTTAASTLLCYLEVPSSFFVLSFSFTSQLLLCYSRKQTPTDVTVEKTFYIPQCRDYIWRAIFFCRAVTYMMGFTSIRYFRIARRISSSNGNARMRKYPAA